MDVERQIRNALEARFEKFGSADLKNIKLPMELFRIVLPWESGTRAQSSAPRSSKKSPVLIGAAVLVIIAFIVGGWWWSEGPGKHQQSAGTQPAPVAPTNAPDQKSVAVLPFVNLSDDKGSEYFSDGVSEELLTVLQKIPGLHVAARTSAFSFKGKNATAQEIGQKLGVAHLVEGSVRKAGDAVRIAARLTRADTGEELWSENYTRDLKDVFAVQTELAQTIVEQLRGRFGGADTGAKEKIQAEVQAAEKGGTKNVEAHELYLQGRFYENRHSDKSTREALAAYQHAVELDPGFARAWAGVARTHTWIAGFATEGGQKVFDAHLASARDAVARALAIEPDLPDALYARAWLETNFDFNWSAATQTVSKAMALAPADPNMLIAAANLETALGNTDRAIEIYRKAVELDPVNAQSRSFLAFGLANTKRFTEARAEYARVIELNPSAPWAHAGLGLAYLLQNKFEEAATEAQADAGEWARLLIVSCARWAQKRAQESAAALNELIKNEAELAAFQIAEAYAYRGDRDRAFEWLERARRQRDPGLGNLRRDPLLENLRSDPRWNTFLHTMGLADEQVKTSAL
jgi:TolB-like protein/Tfp pilus assembly protein PilF